MNVHFPLLKIRTIGDELTLSLAKNSHFSFLPSHFTSLPSRRGHHCGAEIRNESTQPLLGNAVHLQLHIHQDSLLLLLHLPSSQSLRSQPLRLFEVSKQEKHPDLMICLLGCCSSVPLKSPLPCVTYLTSLSLFWIISFPMENCLHSAGLQEQR